MVQPGIALKKPTTGRFVQLDDGRFMVPYATTIPGTDVEFWMMPIPGGKFHMGSEDKEHPDEGPVLKSLSNHFGWQSTKSHGPNSNGS